MSISIVRVDSRPEERAIDALDIIDAAYAGGTETEWLRSLADSFRDEHMPAFAYTYRADRRRGVRIEAFADAGPTAPGWAEIAGRWLENLPHRVAHEFYFANKRVTLALNDSRNERVAAELRMLFERTSCVDAVCLFGVIGGRGVIVGQPLLEHRPLSARRRALLAHVAAHVCAARRLRDNLDPLASVDAVLSPSGSLLHSDVRATGRRARGALIAAVKSRAMARARVLPENRAVEIWHALVDGEWSLIDHVDTDGKRFVLARRNPLRLRDPAALTQRERAVVVLAASACSNKEIGYELGLMPSTVASHLSSGMRKLRIRSRAELVRTLGARDVFEDPGEAPAG